MRKIFSAILAMLLVFSLAACSQTGNNYANGSTETADNATVEPSGSEDSGSDATTPAFDGNVLIAYFSWSGNTEEMATYIQEKTDGDIFEIQPVEPYPTDYNECGDVALEERDSNARPEIQNLPESVDGYDAIFIGYPIWWHTAPMIIGTFLENYNLTGVDIYPFTQSASMDTEQFNNSMDFIRETAEGASVHDGLFARPSQTGDIDAYLSENGFGGR